MNSPIIEVKKATMRLDGRPIWKRLDLTVAAGECIAIVGPNGSGKSSLIKALLGLYNVSGSVTVFGASPQKARQRIGYIPQQKTFDRDIPMTGRDLVQLGVNGTRWFLQPLSQAEEAQVDAAIAEVGATAYAHLPLGRLSGGEQQRLRIAQAIVTDPPILLCDEPLLSLDLGSQTAVARIINKRRQKGTAVLFVTHEINPILPFVDRVLYLVGGKWAVGSPADILTSAQLTTLYGVPVEVLRVHGRIIVVSAGEHEATEPQATHHHEREQGSGHG